MFYSTNIVELKKKMIECGINSTTELSEKAKVNRNTLGRVLSGKIRPSADVMYKIAKVLNLSKEQAGSIFFETNLRMA